MISGYSLPVSQNITAMSPESLGVALRMLTNTNPTSTAWPTANRAFYIPFSIKQPITIKRLFALNGGTATGNMDLGIYTQDGTRIISTGSTAMSGATTIQSITITATVLGPGQYYMAIALSSTSGTNLMWVQISPVNVGELGVLQQASALPLPANATFASTSSILIPAMGLSQLTLI